MTECNHPPEAVHFIELIDHPERPTPQKTYTCDECGAIEGDEGFEEDVVVDRLRKQVYGDD